MGVRKGTLADLDLVVEMGVKFAQESPYRDWCDKDNIRKVFIGCLSSEDKVMFIYDDIGFIAGSISKIIYGSDAIASELAWWVDPSHRNKGAGEELISVFEKWAYENGSTLIAMISLDFRVGDYYVSRGYFPAEHTYVKVL